MRYAGMLGCLLLREAVAVSKSRYKEIADKLHRSGVGVDSDKALEV